MRYIEESDKQSGEMNMFGKLGQEFLVAFKSCRSKMCTTKFQLFEFNGSSNSAAIRYNSDRLPSLSKFAESELGKYASLNQRNETEQQMNTFFLRLSSVLSVGHSALRISMFTLLLGLVSVSGVKSNTPTETWDAEYDGTITVDGDSVTLAYLVGRVNIGFSDGGPDRLNTIKLNGNVGGTPSRAKNPGNHIDDSEFDGFAAMQDDNEWRIGTDFTYGAWYFQTPDQRGCLQAIEFCSDFIFVANVDNIRSLLSVGDAVTSHIKYDYGDIDDSTGVFSADATELKILFKNLEKRKRLHCLGKCING